MKSNNNKGFGVDRRGFLKGVASVAVAAGAAGLVAPGQALADSTSGEGEGNGRFGRGLLPPPDIGGQVGTEHYWRKVRRQFGLADDYIHLNTGTTGSQPKFVQNNLATYNYYKSQDPRDWQANLNADFPDLFPIVPSAMAARQAQVAAVYGANQGEIVLSYNTTDACNLLISGIPWQPGDRVVTTSFEHNALVGPLAWARDYRGIDLSIVYMPPNFTADITVADVLGWFETALSAPLPTGARQFLAISEVFYKNGLRLPIPELCALARQHGAFTIIDSAHGWGMLPVDCHAYGADFIAGAGHKWLCGGPGTGILYVRNSDATAHPLPPFAMGNFVAYGNLFVGTSANFDSRAWTPASAMQGRGETNVPALYAMTDSLAFFNQIGIQAIYERGVALGNYFKGLIANQWGPGALWVQQNPDSRFATALTSFNPFQDRNNGASHSAMVTAINTILANLAAETPKAYVRSVTFRAGPGSTADDRVGFRVATHGVYNNFEELDYVFSRLVYHVNQSGLAQLS